LKRLILFTRYFIRFFRNTKFHGTVNLLWTIANPKYYIVGVHILIFFKLMWLSFWFLTALRHTSIISTWNQPISCSL
jgi:hypothetical protein